MLLLPLRQKSVGVYQNCASHPYLIKRSEIFAEEEQRGSKKETDVIQSAKHDMWKEAADSVSCNKIKKIINCQIICWLFCRKSVISRHVNKDRKINAFYKWIRFFYVFAYVHICK